MHVLKRAYVAFEVRRETVHSVGLVAPLMRRADWLLDVDRGSGHVTAALAGRGCVSVFSVDIADLREGRCVRRFSVIGRLTHDWSAPWSRSAFRLERT